MNKRSARQRAVDLTVAAVTWCAAVAAVMWFYDWVSRWYVVVGVLLGLVAMAMVGDRRKREGTVAGVAAASVDVLPLQRTPEATEPGWSAKPEQQIA